MEKEYVDIEITCVECGVKFAFEAGEQLFFDTKGYTYPKRCKTCRNKKKAAMETNNNTAFNHQRRMRRTEDY